MKCPYCKAELEEVSEILDEYSPHKGLSENWLSLNPKWFKCETNDCAPHNPAGLAFMFLSNGNLYYYNYDRWFLAKPLRVAKHK